MGDATTVECREVQVQTEKGRITCFMTNSIKLLAQELKVLDCRDSQAACTGRFDNGQHRKFC